MQKFLNDFYQSVSPELQEAFQRMLDMQDPQLYDLLVGKKTSSDRYINQVIEYIHR